MDVLIEGQREDIQLLAEHLTVVMTRLDRPLNPTSWAPALRAACPSRRCRSRESCPLPAPVLVALWTVPAGIRNESASLKRDRRLARLLDQERAFDDVADLFTEMGVHAGRGARVELGDRRHDFATPALRYRPAGGRCA